MIWSFCFRIYFEGCSYKNNVDKSEVYIIHFTVQLCSITFIILAPEVCVNKPMKNCRMELEEKGRLYGADEDSFVQPCPTLKITSEKSLFGTIY